MKMQRECEGENLKILPEMLKNMWNIQKWTCWICVNKERSSMWNHKFFHRERRQLPVPKILNFHVNRVYYGRGDSVMTACHFGFQLKFGSCFNIVLYGEWSRLCFGDRNCESCLSENDTKTTIMATFWCIDYTYRAK